MAIVKIHPIKKTPSKGIEYIVNPEKTKDGILVTGINTVADPKLAHIDMKNMRERYSMKRENKCFHFVHSFNSKDNITAEQSHEFTLDWCKRVFGDKAQYIVATHDDQKHKHTHIIVNNVNILGQSMDFTKTWLYNAKRLSNQLCAEYGLVNSITKERPQRRQYTHYKEDMESKKGNSWKDKLAKDIDNLMFKVNSMDQFFSSLNALGYELKQGKYNMLVKPSKGRYMNFYKLGAGYSLQNIEATINYTKNHPKTKYQLKQRGLITLEAIHILNHNQNKLQELREEYNRLSKSADPLDKERCKQISKEIKDVQKAFAYLKDIDKTIEQKSLQQLEIEARNKSDKITFKERELER